MKEIIRYNNIKSFALCGAFLNGYLLLLFNFMK